jgi:hypothetical protein
MELNDLFKKLYGESAERPEEVHKPEPQLKSRSGRAFLETLKNGPKPTDLRTADPGSESD